MSDKIKPSHYTVDLFAISEQLGLNNRLFSAFKYIARAGKKEGESAEDDLGKAIECLQMEIAARAQQPRPTASDLAEYTKVRICPDPNCGRVIEVTKADDSRSVAMSAPCKKAECPKASDPEPLPHWTTIHGDPRQMKKFPILVHEIKTESSCTCFYDGAIYAKDIQAAQELFRGLLGRSGRLCEPPDEKWDIVVNTSTAELN